MALVQAQAQVQVQAWALYFLLLSLPFRKKTLCMVKIKSVSITNG